MRCQSLSIDEYDFFFSRAMSDGTKSNKERIALLKIACNKHQKLYRDAMNGMGFDRHMFGLFVACRGLGYVSSLCLLVFVLDIIFMVICPYEICGG